MCHTTTLPQIRHVIILYFWRRVPHGTFLSKRNQAQSIRMVTKVINPLPWGHLQKPQTSKLPNLTTCARALFRSFAAERRQGGPGRIAEGT